METNSRPPGATRSAAASTAGHIWPVWCSTPHAYTTSKRPSAAVYAESRIEPCSMGQSLPGANASRSAVLAATDAASKSNDRTRAPSRRAASENRPLPQPTSRKDRSRRCGTPSAWVSEAVAVAIRSSSTRRTKELQLSPKAKRCPLWISPTALHVPTNVPFDIKHML